MWAHLSPYTDKKDNPTAHHGKELCDLLVVFENDLFIFEDKAIAWPEKGDLEQRWSRWHRKAVTEAAAQAVWAKKWLAKRPERVFADPACSTLLPVALPAPEHQRTHLIVVANGASKACRAHFGGGLGSLMLNTHPAAPEQPFSVGCAGPNGEFVHVFNESTLELTLGELDTISEFRDYLLAKERLVAQGKHLIAPGEEDVLGYYLQHEDPERPNTHGFGDVRKFDVLGFEEGIWLEFARSVHKRVRDEANKHSYDWDELINRFAEHSIEGTQYLTTHGDPQLTERTLRFMNAEPRTIRRTLVEMSYRRLTSLGERPYVFWSFQSPVGQRALYSFVALRRDSGEDYDDYRSRRLEFLTICTTLIRLERPGAGAYVGIAMGHPGTGENSEDLLLLTDEAFTPMLQEEARRYQRDFGLLANLKEVRSREREYPSPMLPLGIPKGAARNAPCPCGSDLKWKKCCGRPNGAPGQQ